MMPIKCIYACKYSFIRDQFPIDWFVLKSKSANWGGGGGGGGCAAEEKHCVVCPSSIYGF